MMPNIMIADIVLSLQNGFENRGIVIPYFHKNNLYDCCIKVGNDLVSQKVNYKNKILSLRYIPVLILKCVFCFIGDDSIIEINKFQKDIEILKDNNIDFENLLFISNNCCIKSNDSYFFIKDMNIGKITQLIGFIPNIISKEEFLNNYSRPLIDSSGGFFSSDGTEYNRFENLEITQSTVALSSICYKYTGNLIGVISIFDSFKSYVGDYDNTDIFNYLYKKFNSINQFIYIDLLLSYSWIDLDKINKAVNNSGVTILTIVGINIISDIEYVIIKEGKKETTFYNSPEFCIKIKKHISKFFKQNIQINEVLYF